MGADRGIHVEVPLDTMLSVQPIHVSKILAELAKKEVYTKCTEIILDYYIEIDVNHAAHILNMYFIKIS